VHYRCLKLNSEEITAIENTEGKNNYICKLCIEKDKTTCTSPVYTHSITNNVIVTHKFQSGAQAILEEELINTCNTCNLPIQTQDISKNNNSRRASKLKELIADCELQVNFHGPTFINAKGVEISEIDYFLYKTTAQVFTEKIDDTHVSDHHPIKLKLIRTLKRKKVVFVVSLFSDHLVKYFLVTRLCVDYFVPSWSQLYAREMDVLDSLVFLLLSTVYELICFVLSLF
jgi:hypothetical protein